jgi:hypothetical protein
MGIKEKMLERIERDSIKVNVNGDVVYLKKSGLIKEWHVIYPPVNPDTRKWDKINLIFGGKSNALKTLGIVVFVGLMVLGIYDVIHSYSIIVSNPQVQSCLKEAGIILG